MLRALAFVAVLLALAPSVAGAQIAPSGEVSAQTAPSGGSLYFNDTYDHNANPYRDLERAVERAAAENKHVLIVVGGDWCVWCDILDRFLAQNADVHAAFAQSFVILKVNWSRQNENEAFLSGFPESVGYPDFFIVDGRGQFLAQQPTDLLEQGRSYNRAAMLAFAQRWRP